MTQCKAKRAYATWGDAVHGALIGSSRTHARLRIYVCNVCGKYHLTKQPKKARRGPT